MKIVAWDGKPISKAGIYSGVPMSAYHSGRLCIGPSISSSGLRTIFSESEAHYWDQSPLNPNAAPRTETESFIKGRAMHHLTAGEKFFSKEFVVQPDALEGEPWQGNRKACKKWMKAAADSGITVLKPQWIEDIKGMAIALGKEPLVRAGALNGEIECTMAWPDEETGVWLLARPDVIPTSSGDVVDLKTTTSVKYEKLVRAIGDYGYHQQGALIAEGYRVLVGRPIASFSLYFIESSRPYCARMVTLKDEDLKLGAQHNRNAVRRFVEALNNNYWAGPGGRQDAVQYIEISDYARGAAEARLKFEGTD